MPQCSARCAEPSGSLTLATDASLREGALQRYLAEAVWLPPSLLPSERLQWTAMDESHARATLHDGETVATLQVGVRSQRGARRVLHALAAARGAG